MTVDKFGHYFKKNSNELKTKNLLKRFSFILDGSNINVENRRIINIASPLDEFDAVNKTYIHLEIKRFEEDLKNYISEELQYSNRNFINKFEARINKIEQYISNNNNETEKLKKDYDSQLNIIKTNIKLLQDSLTKDIDKDIKIITKAVNDQIYSANKDFIKSIEERFNKIEGYIFKWIDNNPIKVDVIKKQKLEPPPPIKLS